jgi:hypothetical protein
VLAARLLLLLTLASACATDDAPGGPVEFWLPLQCGTRAQVGQGNFSDFSHNGLASHAFDILLALDTPVMAMAAGEVVHVRDENRPGDPCHDGGDESCFDFANLVVLRHADGTLTLYKHLNEALVAEGAPVERGALLGRSGSTGWSTRPHLHVMRMEDCGGSNCQSIALEFVEAGVPETGDFVTAAPCP